MPRFTPVLATLLLVGCGGSVGNMFRPELDQTALTRPSFEKDIAACRIIGRSYMADAHRQIALALRANAPASVPPIEAFYPGENWLASDGDQAQADRGSARCLEDRGYRVTNWQKLMLTPKTVCMFVCSRIECVADEEQRCRQMEQERRERLESAALARKPTADGAGAPQ